MRRPSRFPVPRTRLGRFLGGAVVLGGLGALGTLPGCAYIAQAAKGHFELMAGAVPVEVALDREDLSDTERERLLSTASVKEYGEDVLGLSPTKNYEKVNLDFDQVIWNVSGCAPDRFVSHVYRYPVVGDLPYIGYFDRADADAERARLEELGWEVYTRTAGAYSTLGWFQDPLWRSHLRWDVEQFANTVLHELAHATLWIPGEGRFNESFASFVGDEAAARYMESIRAEQPDAYRLWQERTEDSTRYRVFFHDLYKRLDALYASGLPREEVLERKAQTIAEARVRYRAEPWNGAGYAAAMNDDREINNARLVQFRVYNSGKDVFDEALERFDGDLRAFLDAARRLPALKKGSKGPWNPFDAMASLGPDGSEAPP